ncbi:MAG TPA: phage antirepressor KilAC domain-containing protein [Candidatus Nitrosocosmicus sp.]|nr:phage antirepressor KilAC domain-containing protein [Candidatus Nitrosocosmicus sp.]
MNRIQQIVDQSDSQARMSVKDVALSLGCHIDTIHNWINKLYPDLNKNGIKTMLSAYEVTQIKKAMSNNYSLRTDPKLVTTDIEMYEKTLEVVQWQLGKINEYRNTIQIMAPKAEFYDAVTGSSDTIDLGECAKVLAIKNVGRNKLFEILRDKNILMQKNQPYQKYVDAGYFRIVESTYTKPDGSTHISIKTVVYQKGLDFIRKLVA